MINTTNNIVIINNKNLLNEIKKSFKEVEDIFIKHYNVNNKIESSNKNHAFLNIIQNNNFNNLSLDFLNEAINFILDPKSDNIYVKYGLINKNILLHKPNLRNGTRTLLLSLWKNKVILLPLTFNTSGFNLNEKYLSLFDNDIIKKIKLDTKNNNNLSDYFKKSYIPNISKVIMATNYEAIKDLSLNEINEIHIFIIKSKKGLIKENVPNINYYIEYFLIFCNNNISLDNFNETEYRRWLSGFFSRKEELNYLTYIDKKPELLNYRKNYVNKQTKSRKLKNKKEIEKEYDIELIQEEDITIEKEFLEISKSKKYSWCKSIPVFDNYGFDNNDDYKLWIQLYDKYIEHRQNNGYETERTLNYSFNFLMNYIFFYLKHWSKTNKEPIDIPKSPKDFHRVLYINKSLNQEGKQNYHTIKDLLFKSNISLSNKNSKLRGIQLFFEFIIDFYDEDEKIWNLGSKNPIRKNDFYISRRSKKTNKKIVPKNIYSKLKKYLFSIEHFGDYLLEKSINDDIKLSTHSHEAIKTEDHGFVPVFFDKGQTYPLLEIPNLYLFRERTFNKNKVLNNEGSNIITKRIPSNTVIRATILMLNTGLRAAQVSWIDRENWNINESDLINAYYKINVNTDKTKENEWTSFISHNVYSSLIKETNFQNSMKEKTINKTINYQNREHTRFNDILPLFRGYSNSGLPVDFRSHWNSILWTFQNNINRVEEKNYQLIKIEKPETEKIDLIGIERLRYSPLSIKSIYTPHSMRATFCTHMAEYLERSEIAALVGHESDLITSEVYIKPEESTIIEKMNEATDIFDNGVNSDYFNKDSLVHTKPNAENSSLQKAFATDRDQTIELFNISSISMNINKESEDQSNKAIDLLKNSRMDHIIFETTHICPVGGICPQEVMSAIGEKRRCGLCPLALKCVDNLNPIYAKQRDLIREIKEDKNKLEKAINNKDSEITINNIEDKVNLDIRELVSWKFSADILSKNYEDLKLNKNLDKKYYVEMPDMVKNHLNKVSVSNEKEYLLTRIADANAYSGYSNAENKYQADIIKRHVIKNLNLFEYDDYHVSEEDKIEVFCSMITNMMETNGVDLKELVNYDCFKSIENKKEQKKLLFKNIKLLK